MEMYVHDSGWQSYSTDAAYTVYYVNTNDWETVKAYAWNTNCDKNDDWGGQNMTNTGKTYNGKAIYSVSLGKYYLNVIFNDNGSNKTEDLHLGGTNKGKLYNGSNWVDYVYDVTMTFDANGHGVAPSSSTVLQGNAVSAPVAPTAEGYTFDGWYENQSCTGDAWNFSTTISANKTLYAKWTLALSYSLTVEAGTGINSVSGSANPITLGSSYPISATPAEGYAFSTWSKTSGAGTANFTSASSASTSVTVTDGSVIVTANATEKLSHVTVSSNNVSFGTVNIDQANVGVATHQTLTATPKPGFLFNNWTLTGGAILLSGSLTDATITIKGDGTGSTGTAVATFIEDLSCDWYIAGTAAQFGGWETNGTRMTKKAGESTIDKYYAEIVVTTLPGDNEWAFKLYNSATSKYWAADGHWVNREYPNHDLSTGGENMQFKPDITGTYTFMVDNTNPDAPKLTLTCPTAYTVTFEHGNYGSVTPATLLAPENATIVHSGTSLSINDQSITAQPHANENGWTFTHTGWTVPGNVPQVTQDIAITANFDCTWDGGDILSLNYSGTPKTGKTITINVTNKGLFGPYSYTYDVMEPGESGYRTFYSGTDASKDFPLSGGGTYTFRVSSTVEGVSCSNTIDVVVDGSIMYLRYKYQAGPKDLADNWTNVIMTDNGDGTFTYYNDGTGTGTPSRFYSDCGANVGATTEFDDASTYFHPIGYAEEGKKITDQRGTMADGDPVVWIYNSLTDQLTVSNPNSKKYRLAITVDTKTYYSNEVTAGSAQDISFYCTGTATLSLEEYTNSTWSTVTPVDKPAAISANGVYAGTITITEPSTVAWVNIAPYTGDYFVTSKATDPSVNIMTDFTSSSTTYYNHYLVKWVEAGNNTFAMVGNSINNNLANAIGDYTLPEGKGANVRYAYNPSTNVFTRTHLAGSSSTEKYVAVYGTNVQDTTSTHDLTSPENAVKFIDCSDWVYSVSIRSSGNSIASSIKLVAQYNGTYTYLLTADGSDAIDAKKDLCDAGNLLGERPLFNVIYDYKTNKIISGWSPVGVTVNNEISVQELINTRTNDDPTSEFTINSGHVVATNKMITQFVITRDMWDSWTGSTNGDYKTMFFWFSVPYDFRVADIYGFAGTYGISTAVQKTSWEIQSYHGEMRDAGTAGSSPWKRPKVGVTLDANAGYVLAVRLRAEDFKSIIIDKDLPSEHTISEVRFFIPSSGSVTLNPTVTETLEEYTTNPAWYNQDWHVMNVPVMASGCKMVEQDKETAPFESVYQWTWANGERWYDPVAVEETTFKAGHAYMVQGHGILTWSYPADPKPLMARKNTVSRTNTKFRIDLIQNDELQDKTYVLYRADGTRAYEIGRDLEKITNEGRSMIYSEHDIRLASICLANTDNMQIPLTVVAAESGEYTLRIPTQVEGIEPVLYDALTNQETLLNYGELTLTLSAGTYRDRFYLGVHNKQATPTTIEDVYGNKDQVFKYIDNSGNLMILRNGHTYDAVGHLIR